MRWVVVHQQTLQRVASVNADKDPAWICCGSWYQNVGQLQTLTHSLFLISTSNRATMAWILHYPFAQKMYRSQNPQACALIFSKLAAVKRDLHRSISSSQRLPRAAKGCPPLCCPGKSCIRGFIFLGCFFFFFLFWILINYTKKRSKKEIDDNHPSQFAFPFSFSFFFFPFFSFFQWWTVIKNICPLDSYQAWITYYSKELASNMLNMGIKKSNINRAITTAGSLKRLELTSFFFIRNFCSPNKSHNNWIDGSLI